MAKTKIDPIWDVICELFELDPQTKREHARISRVVSDLRAKRATKHQIREVHQRCCQEWRGKIFGPEALVKWFDQFKVAPKQDRPLPRTPTEADEAEDLRRWLRRTGQQALPHQLALLKRYPKKDKP